MSFAASLLIIVALLNRKLRKTHAHVFIVVALVSLIGAYTAGSCRQTDTTVYVVSLVGAVLVYISFLLLLVWAAFKISRTKTGIWCKELVVWAIDAMLKPKPAAQRGGENTNGRYYRELLLETSHAK